MAATGTSSPTTVKTLQVPAVATAAVLRLLVLACAAAAADDAFVVVVASSVPSSASFVGSPATASRKRTTNTAATKLRRLPLYARRTAAGSDKSDPSSPSSSRPEFDDNDDDDPDSRGTHVDGFPLPPVPVLDNDEELLRSIRAVPVSWASLNEPTKTRELLLSTGTTVTQQQLQQRLRVIVAGGGLGGLALASALVRKGYDAYVFEQATRYKPFGGPIQIQSNALEALRKINPALFEAISQAGVRTGDRSSGIKDGKRWKDEGWLVKFDAATPALKKGLPLTLAINRVALQEIFLKYGVPEERVRIGTRVVSYENLPAERGGGVAVHTEDGQVAYGDVLVGADGIWSRVRHHMYDLPPDEIGIRFAHRHARYSGYTCYTGTCQHTPSDVDEVAYKVFLGQRQYWGCTDCGSGWQHWWAFLPDDPPPPTATTTPTSSKETGGDMLDRLKREFRDWSPEVLDLLDETVADVVKRRPLYDRLPLWGRRGWVDGRVALLGDAAHPTMPNLGQGGAMAIEDAYALGEELDGIRHTDEIPNRLRAYQRRRFLRASIAQFLSRNGSDLLVDWDRLRTTPVIGPVAMWLINAVFQPLSMSYLYSADI